jgi:hypothetical protein
MRTLLTSFGIGQSDMPGSSYFRRPPLVTTDRLAPQHLGSLDFFPDYATLLLSERILLDEMSFDLLKSGKSDDQFAKAYQLYAALKSEGLVEVYDYEAVLAGNPDTVERAIAADLQNVPLWIEACVESSDLWGALGDILRARGVGLRDPMLGYKGHVLRNDLNMIRTSWNVYCADQARGGGKGDDLRREVARNLDTFLRYVNVNMLLANHFDATIADWFDFRPFYERKFVGSSQAEVKRGHISKLFELSFPFVWRGSCVISELRNYARLWIAPSAERWSSTPSSVREHLPRHSRLSGRSRIGAMSWPMRRRLLGRSRWSEALRRRRLKNWLYSTFRVTNVSRSNGSTSLANLELGSGE